MRILLTRFGGLGDLLFIEPTIRAIHEKYKPHEIVFRTYVEFFGALEHHPLISSVVYDHNEYTLGYKNNLTPKPSEFWFDIDPDFDMHFDFHEMYGSMDENINNPDMHATQVAAECAGVEIKNNVPQIPFLKKDVPSYPIVAQLVSHGGIVDGAIENRSLNDNEELLEALSGYDVRFIGEEKLDHQEFVSIINNCDLFVGTESCGVIIARGLNKRTIGIYKNNIRVKNRSFDKMSTLTFEEIYKIKNILKNEH